MGFARVSWVAGGLLLAGGCAAQVDAEELELDNLGLTEQSAAETWTLCSQEWQRCSFTGTRRVRYGANGTYAAIRSFTDGVDCRNSSFGGDPVPGITKRCELASEATAPTPAPIPAPGPAPASTGSETWVRCSQEWQRCSFTGARRIRYGANGIYAPIQTFSNGVDCRNSSFGGTDPVPGVTKACDYAADSSTPVPAPAPAPSPPASNGRLPHSAANPIIYTNDHPEDVHTDVIMMALQSNGAINLRGIITDNLAAAPGGCSGDGCHTAAIDDALRREWAAAARASGFRNIPDSVTGSAGVDLIVREARAASVDKPLVIMTAGLLTVVADAYRRDPSIASKVIVVMGAFAKNQWTGNLYRAETNVTTDLAAAQTVLQNLRCVILPYGDFGSTGVDAKRYPATPRSRVDGLPNRPLRAKMQSIYAYPWAHYDADGGPAATLLSPSYVTGVKNVRWATDNGGAYLADDATSDDILVTGMDGAAVTEPWWSQVTAAFSR